MEPIKINIEVNLGQPTIAALRLLLKGGSSTAAPIETKAVPATKVQEIVPKTAVNVPKTEETVPKVQEIVPKQPETVSEQKAPEITDEALRLAVKAAKDRLNGNITDIRALFKSFGISSSSECLAERRAELLQSLNELKAA